MHRHLFLAAALTLLTAPALSQLPPCENCPCTCEEVEQGPEQVFFGYLHAHTSYSDGEGTPREAYVHARDRGGLDFLALTPHNHRDAGKIATQPDLYHGDGPDALVAIAAEMTVDGSFVALYGQEFSSISKGNHVGVLDAPTVIDTANGEYDDLVNDYLPANPDSTGKTPLLVLNHPDSGPRSREYGRDDFGGNEAWVAEVYADEIGGPSFSFEDPIEVRLHEGDGPLEIHNMRYHGGREYYVFRITQFDESDDTSDHAWLAPVWFEPPGLPELAPTAFPAVPDAVAAVDSELFHRESCPIAEGIAEEDRVTGSEATAGRVAHRGCVGHEDER